MHGPISGIYFPSMDKLNTKHLDLHNYTSLMREKNLYIDSTDFFNMHFKFVSYVTNTIPSYMSLSRHFISGYVIILV